MGVFEAIVVFTISWWVVFLPILSAGTRSQHEAGDIVPGSERGAPVVHGLVIKAAVATAAAAVFTTVLWFGFRFGWFDSWIPQTYS